MSENNNDFQNTPNEKKHFSVTNIIFDNKYLFVLCMLLAVVVWIATSLSVGTDENRTIKVDTNINLEDQMSEQLGMKYFSLQNSAEIKVTISGAKYVIGQVKAEDLNVTFDTSGINRTGIQNVPIQVSSKKKTLDFDVVSISPSSIECYFDVEATKSFKIDTRFDNDVLADGYVFGTPVLTEDRVVVTGPKNYVDNITSAYVEVDFGANNELKEPFVQDCDIQFEGTDVDTSFLTVKNKIDDKDIINQVGVTLPVLKVTQLPVISTFENKPIGVIDGAVSVSYSMNRLTAGVLQSADITSANIGSIDFNDITVGSQKITFKTDKISGIKVLDDTKEIVATVRVSSQYTTKRITINKNNIKFVGVPTGTTPKVNYLDNYSVTVVCPVGTEIKQSDLTLKCDLSEENKEKTYPLDISISNNQCWIYGKYNAIIK